MIISLHSFVIISFIKTIARATQIHQPITFDYFDINQSLINGRSMISLCACSRKNNKNDIRRGKIQFLRQGSVFRRTIHNKRLFNTSYKMAISVQNSMLKVNYFLSRERSTFKKKCKIYLNGVKKKIGRCYRPGAVSNIKWNATHGHQFNIFRAEDPSLVTHAFSTRAMRNFET